MKLPGGERAIVGDDKLSGYCLNSEPPEGRHKARVFQSLLGLGPGQAPILKEALREAAAGEPAERVGTTPYGDLYIVDFVMLAEDKTVPVRPVWIIRSGEEVPRLVSCYVRKLALRGGYENT